MEGTRPAEGPGIRTLVLYLRNGSAITTAIEGGITLTASQELPGRLRGIEYTRPTKDGVVWVDPGEVAAVEIVSDERATVQAPAPPAPYFIGDGPPPTTCPACGETVRDDDPEAIVCTGSTYHRGCYRAPLAAALPGCKGDGQCTGPCGVCDALEAP